MTVTVEEAARLFLHQVWKLHGLPKYVISDRGPQFIARFTKELYRLLGIKLASSTAWHPQTDGQTEHINQELDQYLQLFVNKRQDNWYDLLPMAEFQHNNHVYSTVTPLENFLQKCNMGYTLYPWISLLESTLETSYKPQT